jgi:hypothetical protein
MSGRKTILYLFWRFHMVSGYLLLPSSESVQDGHRIRYDICYSLFYFEHVISRFDINNRIIPPGAYGLAGKVF